MARAAARVNDFDTGHSNYHPRPAIQGSPDVYFNSRAAHRQNDRWAVHSGGTPHDGFLSSGSPYVYTNGKQQGRVNDPISCGSFVNTGSPDVFFD